MRRRDFITLFGVAFACPIAARAQQPMPVIGLLSSASTAVQANFLRAFQRGLGEVGYIESQNVVIEYRGAEEQNDRLPALAAELVRRQVSVIVAAGSTPAALTAKAATSTIPIVFQVGSDPIAAGLVGNLAHPGGNVTGVTALNTELGPKRLELLRELVPTARVIALLVNPTSPFITEGITKDLQSAARGLGVELHVVNATSERDFDAVFTSLAQLKADALIIAPDTLFISRSEQLGALTVRHRVPAITQFREFTVGGGLMSYGGSFTDAARQVGIYTGRILRGEKPADLPVQQLAKLELVINLKTAKSLGLNVPLSLLGRADEVIE
jgi:putative ABC transport system substrate-binding protein